MFADTLLALAREDGDILAVTGDSRGSGKLGPFGKALPEQIVEVGIAEQNLVGILSELDCLRAALGAIYNNSSIVGFQIQATRV